MDIPETIRKIKTELRLAMNGVASAYMRENGMNYKLNFGVELPRLRDIAAGFPADHDLAQALWKEDIRECKLLAAMLQPTDTFYPEIADIWVEAMPNTEIASEAYNRPRNNPLQNFPHRKAPCCDRRSEGRLLSSQGFLRLQLSAALFLHHRNLPVRLCLLLLHSDRFPRHESSACTRFHGVCSSPLYLR